VPAPPRALGANFTKGRLEEYPPDHNALLRPVSRSGGTDQGKNTPVSISQEKAEEMGTPAVGHGGSMRSRVEGHDKGHKREILRAFG